MTIPEKMLVGAACIAFGYLIIRMIFYAIFMSWFNAKRDSKLKKEVKENGI